MKRTIYTMLLACAAMLLSIPSFAQQSNYNLLYIASSDPAAGGDVFLIDSLTDMGYNVTAIEAAAFNEFSHTDFSADVIVFGEALSSSAVTPFATASFPVPCVSLEGYCPRANRWALLASDDDFGQIRDDAQYVITPVIPNHYTIDVIADHPIVAYAGLTSGSSALWSDEATVSPEVVWYDAMPQAAATPLADINGGTDLHTMWAIEPDANDATNPLNHRLVIWGVHENGLTNGLATPVFYDLLDGAILWVLGENTTGINAADLVEGLVTQPNPFTDKTSVEFSLTTPANVALEVYDLAGRLVARESGMFGAGSQAMEFVRPESMTNGMYHFSLQVDGKLSGSGKMMVR